MPVLRRERHAHLRVSGALALPPLLLGPEVLLVVRMCAWGRACGAHATARMDMLARTRATTNKRNAHTKARRCLRRRLRRSHCKNHPEWVDIDMLAAYAEAPPAGHIIDDPRVHLAEARTFSFGPSSRTKQKCTFAPWSSQRARLNAVGQSRVALSLR